MVLAWHESAHRGGWHRRWAAFVLAAVVMATMTVIGLNSNIGITSSWAAGTPLFNESFTGGSVADSKVLVYGDACLTGAATSSTPPVGASALSHCSGRTSSVTPSLGTIPGWLQLTHNANNRVGGILYNQALPATGGMEIIFDQAQYGGDGADGISFFLTDGNYELTTIGADGGSLGYAQKDGVPGVVGGFLGLGLDWYGNFVREADGRGAGCAAAGQNHGVGGGTIPHSVGIRGPGFTGTDWAEGYCLWKHSALPGQTMGSANLANAIRTVRIRVEPTETNGRTTITVDIDFGSGYQEVITYDTAVEVPETYKFGLAASTGGLNNVHLIRNIQVTSIDELEALNIVKTIDTTSPDYQTAYAEGDVIPYTFTVTNGGALALHSVTVTDPLVTNLSCPGTTLTTAGNPGSSMTCTGTHIVTAAEAAAASGELVNTATASGLTPTNTPVDADPSTAIAELVPADPSIELTKHDIWNDTNSDGLVNLGDTVTYSFSVENTGNITLAPVRISDPLISLSNVQCVASLAPGASAPCGGAAAGIHTINVADLIANQVSNTATATGVTPNPLADVTGTDTVNVPTVPATASLSVEKRYEVSGDDNIADLDEIITYTFRVTNTGSVPLSNIRVTDEMLGLEDQACGTTLIPGQYVDCVAPQMRLVDRDDLRAGSIVNTVFVNADAPVGVSNPEEATDTATVLTADPVLGITLQKIVDNGTTGAGGTPAQWVLSATPSAIPGQSTVTGHGSVNDVSVLPGTYTLSETGGPAGYQEGLWSCVTTDATPVPVNSAGVVTFTADADVTCTITNTARAGSVTWQKTTDDDQPLGGSVWTLTGPGYPGGITVNDCVEASAAACIGPDRDPAAGSFEITDLAWGSYTLVESQAPVGYLLDLTSHPFLVTGATVDGIDLGALVNEQLPPIVLPLTGGLPQDYIHIGGLALLVLALTLGIHRAYRTRRPHPVTP